MLCWEAPAPSSLQGWAVCVIWGGYWVPYHSCSLCIVTFYGEFALRHVRAKWCRLIWCHLLMRWILYCCRYAHVRDSSDSQSPSSARFHAGRQTASPFLSPAPVRAKSLPSSCFQNSLSDIGWTLNFNIYLYCLIWPKILCFWRLDTSGEKGTTNYLHIINAGFASTAIRLEFMKHVSKLKNLLESADRR